MQSPDEYIAVPKIAESLGISTTFLSKILRTLTIEGVLSATRGVKGGVRLAQPAKDIRLLDIIYAIDGDALFTQCILQLPGCGQHTPCPLHAEWGVERERLKRMFERATLEQLSIKIHDLGLNIASISLNEVISHPSS